MGLELSFTFLASIPFFTRIWNFHLKFICNGIGSSKIMILGNRSYVEILAIVYPPQKIPLVDIKNKIFHFSVVIQVVVGAESESRSVLSDSLQPPGLYSPWNSPGQNTGVGTLSLLQGIFPTQGLSPGLPHYKRVLYQLSHKGSPRILQWVVCPFFSESPWPNNRIGVSCIAGRLFTNWAIMLKVVTQVVDYPSIRGRHLTYNL